MQNFRIKDYDSDFNETESKHYKPSLWSTLGDRIDLRLRGKINGKSFYIATPADDDGERVMVCLGFPA